MLSTTTTAARNTVNTTYREPQSSAVRARQHLTPLDLAQRWQLSARTLERWRHERRGPAHLKLGSAVLYRIEDVIAFEAAQWRAGFDGHVAAVAAPAPSILRHIASVVSGPFRPRRSSGTAHNGLRA